MGRQEVMNFFFFFKDFLYLLESAYKEGRGTGRAEAEGEAATPSEQGA